MTIPKLSTATRRASGPDPEAALLIEDTPSVSDSIPITPATPSPASNQQTASDFALIKIVARLTLQLIRKFCAFSSAAALAIILFYWLCGGLVAFALVAFAVTGAARLQNSPIMNLNSLLFFFFRHFIPCNRQISLPPRPTCNCSSIRALSSHAGPHI